MADEIIFGYSKELYEPLFLITRGFLPKIRKRLLLSNCLCCHTCSHVTKVLETVTLAAIWHFLLVIILCDDALNHSVITD